MAQASNSSRSRQPAAADLFSSPYAVAGVFFAAIAFTAVCLWNITAALGNIDVPVWTSPTTWLAGLDSTAAFDTLSNAAEVVAAVLAIAITVVAIVVELAANRYSHLITQLFLREPVNAVVLGLLVVTTIQCVLAAGTLSDAQPEAVLPQAGFVITMALVTASLLALLPYIYFVFALLSPISIINRICRDAFKVIRNANGRRARRAQRKVQAAIDELQDISRSAIAQGDRGIAMAAVDALTSLLFDYAKIKPTLPEQWFDIDGPVSQDADFIALGTDTLRAIESRRTWLEHKIFRQLVALTAQSAGSARDVANLISINTQAIANELGRDDPHLLDLCVRAFNSYLRQTINARDPRSAYYLMNQYRLLAEALLEDGDTRRAVDLAGYFREYGQLAHRVGISFLLEAAAYDVVQLIERALELESDAVDELLDVLLELDQEIKEESHEESLLGVRRSQIQLAALLLMLDQSERATRIMEDLRTERIERLERLKVALEADQRVEYWELMDRGANFAYMPPERRPYLDALFQRLRTMPN